MNPAPPPQGPPGRSGATARRERTLFLFDCYDTLVVDRVRDTGPDPAGIFAHRLGIPVPTAKRILYPLLSAAFRPTALQEPTETVLRAGLLRHGLQHLAGRLPEALWHAVGNADGRHLAAPGAREVLRDIKDAGHAVGVVSNCVLDPPNMHRLLAGLDLAPYIDHGCYSSEGRGKKPDPAFLSRAARGRWEEVVMIGDSPDLDLRPAARLGWQTVRIDPARPHWNAVRRHLRRKPQAD